MNARSKILEVAAVARAARRSEPHPLTVRVDAQKLRAAELLADFTFTRLVESEAVEVWRCMRPNDSHYSHDITITARGIAMMGDLDGLTFNVGMSRGMPFLAGDDIAYYIHSKLEAHCREVEFDENGFLGFIAHELRLKTQAQLELLPDLRDLVPEDGPLAEALVFLESGNAYYDRDGDKELRALVAAIESLGKLDKTRCGAAHAPFAAFSRDVGEFFDDAINAARANTIDDAVAFLREHEGRWVDMSDGAGHAIQRIHSNTLFRLCMLNGSAKRIVAIKDQERARLGDTVKPVEGFERELLKGDGHIGGGDVLALFDLPETPQECFAAGWNRRSELNAVHAAVDARQLVVADPAEADRSSTDRPKGG